MPSPDRPDPRGPRAHGRSADRSEAPSRFRSRQWRFGNAVVSALARVGVGPIALLTTTGRTNGHHHTVPVVPIDHGGQRWLVAPYGPVSWVRNVRAAPSVTLRYGSQRTGYTAREVGAAEAAPVLKRYVAVATRTLQCFDAPADAPADAFIREAADHPVFQLRAMTEPPILRRTHA